MRLWPCEMRWCAMISDLTLLRQAPLVFFDVETTGLDPAFGHRVIEVGIVRCLGREVITEYQQLVNPQRPSDPGAYRVHHISPEMVSDAPLFAQIIDAVLALLEEAVFVGHNTRFDLSFLRAELERAGRPLPRLAGLDTLALAQSCWEAPSYSLDNLCCALRIPKQEHRALGDAHATRRLFWEICDALAEDGVRTLADLYPLQGGKLDWRRVRRMNEPMEPPPIIREALEAGALLWIRYVDGLGASSERIVRPMMVFGQQGQAYLRAYCYLRRQERTFSLERIQEMRVVTDELQ